MRIIANVPGLIEPESDIKYSDPVPLEDAEKRAIRRWDFIYFIPVLLLTALMAWVFVTIYLPRGFAKLEWEMLMFPMTLLIFYKFVRALTEQHESKVIFEAEVTDYFGMIFLSKVWFKGMFESMQPLPFTLRANRVRIGRRYRVHQPLGRKLILKMEEIG